MRYHGDGAHSNAVEAFHVHVLHQVRGRVREHEPVRDRDVHVLQDALVVVPESHLVARLGMEDLNPSKEEQNNDP